MSESFAQGKLDDANNLEEQAVQLEETNPEEAQQLLNKANQIRNNWGEDGEARKIVGAVANGLIIGNVSEALQNTAVSMLGQDLAEAIGNAARDGSINQATQLIAHAALGCGLASASGSNCGTGATSGVTGELVGYYVRQDIENKLASGNVSGEDLDRWNKEGVDLAKFAGGVSALLANNANANDLNAGINTAGNAAENNALFLIPIAVALIKAIDVGLTAKDAYDLAEAIDAGDEEEASRLATEFAINAGLSATVPGGAIANKVTKGIRSVFGKKADNIVAKVDGAEVGTKPTSQTVPDSVTRRDNDFSATTNNKDKKKSYIDEDGTLTPANPDGDITVQQHVRGADPAKGNSQYTSTTAVDDVATTTPKDYGNNTIEIDTKRLQQDIDTGKVKDDEILPPQRVQAELQGNIDKAQARYDANPSPTNSDKLQDAKRDLDHAVRDNECLIKGCVPSDYIQGGQ